MVKYKQRDAYWIQEIPDNWKIEKLKYLTEFISSGELPTGKVKIYLESGIVFIGSQNADNHECIIRPILKNITAAFLFMIMSSEFIENQILRIQNGSVSDKLNLLQIKNLDIILPKQQEEQVKIVKFLDEKTSDIDLLVTDKKRIMILLKQYREAIIREIGKMECLLPNKKEKLVEITNLVNNIKLQTQRLKEYRKSLILEVLTGKIDVRE